jgi:hypothetical protein
MQDNQPITIDAELEQKPREKQKGGMKKGQLAGKTKKAVILAAEHGVELKEAMILAGYKPPLSPATVSRNKGLVEKYSLQTPRMQKLAHKAVLDTLQGKEVRYSAQKVTKDGVVVDYEEVITPSYTNKLAATAMVFDRVDPPVKRTESMNLNVTCDPVDLEAFRRRS